MCTAASSAAAAAAAAGQQLASQHIAADSSAGRRAALSFGSIGTGWRVCFAPARAQRTTGECGSALERPAAGCGNRVPVQIPAGGKAERWDLAALGGVDAAGRRVAGGCAGLAVTPRSASVHRGALVAALAGVGVWETALLLLTAGLAHAGGTKRGAAAIGQVDGVGTGVRVGWAFVLRLHLVRTEAKHDRLQLRLVR